jgi:predicted PurR-regulated permease PerM
VLTKLSSILIAAVLAFSVATAVYAQNATETKNATQAFDKLTNTTVLLDQRVSEASDKGNASQWAEVKESIGDSLKQMAGVSSMLKDATPEQLNILNGSAASIGNAIRSLQEE